MSGSAATRREEIVAYITTTITAATMVVHSLFALRNR